MKKFGLILCVNALIIPVSGCVDSDSDCGGVKCSEHYGISSEYSVTRSPLTAWCSIEVTDNDGNSKGVKNMETDYVPNVTHCENGGSTLQGLRAQAVSARSVAYYKLGSSGKGKIRDSTKDQVYSCKSRAPSETQFAKVLAASMDTNGIILMNGSTKLCAFYVAGEKVDKLKSDCTFSGSASAATQKYVTYNWGKSGSGVTKSTLGSSKSSANQGCMSQNGATCLGKKGWIWENIIRYFYGMDITMLKTEGDCVTEPKCKTQIKNGEVIIDDTDSCFVRNFSDNFFTVGSVQNHSSGKVDPIGYGESMQFAYTWNGNAVAAGTWHVNAASAGNYNVYAYVDKKVGALSANATYTVRARGKESTVKVNLSDKSGWVELGKFEFAAGQDQWVKLTDATGEAYTDANGKRVPFDALKFVSTEGSSCSDECSSNGGTECSGNGVRTCSSVGGCLKWSQVTPCTGNQTCESGKCVDKPGPVCTPECSDGQKACDGQGFKSCQSVDGCLKWSQVTPCGENKTCESGNCVDKPGQACTPECSEGQKACEGQGFKTCESVDGCLKWSQMTPCGEKEICSSGSCIENTSGCVPDCTEGQKKCDEDGYRECGQFDEDECLEWSEVIACESGKSCVNGECKEAAESPVCRTEIDGREETIIDELDDCFEKSESSFWMDLKEYGHDDHLYYSHVSTEAARSVGTWHLNVTKAGRYVIWVKVVGAVGSVVGEQRYVVYASGKKLRPSVLIDEDSDWLMLGAFELEEGTDQYVQLNDQTNNPDDEDAQNRVLFDAIKVVPDAGDVNPPKPGSSGKDNGVDASIYIQPGSSCSVNGLLGRSDNSIWVMLGAIGVFGLGLRRRKAWH